jgi:short-subunit dehydrogenase
MVALSRAARARKFAARYGPWAVVTGATSGLGLELVLELARRGLNLVLVARSNSSLDSLAKNLSEEQGVETRVIAADLCDPSLVEKLLGSIADLDVGLFIGAAGFGTSGLFSESKAEVELAMVDLNCRAGTAMTHHFSRRFRERGKGGLVLFSSLVAFQGVPYSAHYSATKAYVQTLAEALYVELKPHGVDVLSVAPGPVHTGFAQRAGLTMGLAMKPQGMGAVILGNLGRRALVRPGWLSQALELALTPLPRWARVRMMGIIMRGMVLD